MSAPIIGIDLGTTNSVVSVTDENGTPRVLADKDGRGVQPSVVAFPPNGKVLVGQPAKLRKVIDPQNTVFSVKRLMGRTSQSPEVARLRQSMPYRISEGPNQQPIIKTRAGEFAPSDISAIILNHMRDLAVAQIGAQSAESIDRAVITVPANFNEAQRSATATAGAIAGLTVARVLNEPTAAAIAYGHKKQLDKLIAVYDFGGGTFDISLLKVDGDVFEVIGTAGDSMLGGDDIDERLVERLHQNVLKTHKVDLSHDPQAMMRLRNLAEDLKIELSRRMRSQLTVHEIAYGPGGKPISYNADLKRDQFESSVRDLIERTFPVCAEAIKLAGIGLGDITDVVLVGGTSRIPLVRQLVSEFFRQQPRTDLNPEEAIAIGAGLQAEAMRQILDRPSRSMATIDEDTFTGFDTFGGETVEGGTTVRRDQPSPPPVPAGRRTLKHHPVAAGPDQQTIVGEQEANLARIALKKASEGAPARGGIREVARKGAIKQPNATARPYTSDDLPLSSPAASTGNIPAQRAPQGLPTVLDVTPHTLGIATVGGYCEKLVMRNSRLPLHHERIFTAARDGQVIVRVRIYQGESRRLLENTIIGDLILEGLPARARGDTQITVHFDINESGILHVRARDTATGREQQASLNVLGAQTEDEVARAQQKMRGMRV